MLGDSWTRRMDAIQLNALIYMLEGVSTAAGIPPAFKEGIDVEGWFIRLLLTREMTEDASA